LVRGENILYLGEIFQFEERGLSAKEWRIPEKLRSYPESQRAVMSLLAPYFTEAERQFLFGGKVKVKFIPYLYDLNAVR